MAYWINSTWYSYLFSFKLMETIGQTPGFIWLMLIAAISLLFIGIRGTIKEQKKNESKNR